MKIYCEKKFLDDFYSDLDFKNPSLGQKALLKIFREYGELSVFIDQKFESAEELNSLKQENPLISMIADGGLLNYVENIEKTRDDSDITQTIVLTCKTKYWFSEISQKGGLCLTSDNYKQVIEDIINTCHVKHDLSKGFVGWTVLKCLRKLPSKYLIINDSYILKNKKIVDKSLIPLLDNLITNPNHEFTVQIFTNYVGSRRDKDFDPVQVKDIHNHLSNIFEAKSLNFFVFRNMITGTSFRFHDRLIISDFFTIDCGIGFDLWGTKPNNSQIIIESVFDIYTYQRINNLKAEFMHHRKKLRSVKSREILCYPF